MDLTMALIAVLLWFITGFVAGYTTAKLIDMAKFSKDKKRMEKANREIADYVNSLKRNKYEGWRK